MFFQMIRVISSPSSSTTGFTTLILDMFLRFLVFTAAYGSVSTMASTLAPSTVSASTS